MKPTIAFVVQILLVLLAAGCSRPQQNAAGEQDRKAKFKTAMDGTTLQGNMRGFNKDGISKGEKFVVEKVTNIAGDTWLFQMRFQYGSHDIPVPLPIRVAWADDTPVLTLTDVAIPGHGTYTARVLIYGEQYAGMWSSQKGGGGQVFGRVLRRR